jgi:two-component system nitrate/nitrite response regulator NarL
MAASDASRLQKADTTKPVLVFVICRVRLYHDALVKLLNRQGGMCAVGSTEIGDVLIASLDAAAPDTVLLDIGPPEALPFAARLVRARPKTRILGFGVDDVPVKVIACAEAGLCGYVPSQASVAELARAARSVALGDTVCSAGMASKLFHHLRSAALRDPACSCSTDATLTVRQQQILALIKEGLSNKQIAQRLSLGPSTVKNHVHGLLSRLHVGRRSEAAARTSAPTPLQDLGGGRFVEAAGASVAGNGPSAARKPQASRNQDVRKSAAASRPSTIWTG